MENVSENQFTQEDIEKNKIWAILAWIIFFIPLLAAGDSKFARWHANQAFILVILAIANNILGWLLPFGIGWLTLIIGLGIFVLWIIGIVGAINGKAKPLPVIGGITIFK
jgi:uncharacterized membrane protein